VPTKQPHKQTLLLPIVLTNFVCKKGATMLSARALTVQRIAARRTFATAVTDAPHGVKVAALDFGQPSSAVTIVAKAGSRFQNKEGVANALKNFAFKVSIMYVY
jgi:hypothetical protein